MTIANVVYGGNGAFDALLYRQENPLNQLYIEAQLDRVNATLTDSGRAFMAASRELYDQLYNNEAVQLARSALRSAKSLFAPNKVIYLDELEQLQAASPLMMRWVMSQPDLRTLHHQQRCHGYGELYTTDFSPNEVGEADYNWRRVMDGVVVVDTEDEQTGWYSRQYVEDLLPGDRTLDAFEKLDIVGTWDIVRMAIAAGDDPSNPSGGSL
jgi:hypothetical protein